MPTPMLIDRIQLPFSPFARPLSGEKQKPRRFFWATVVIDTTGIEIVLPKIYQ